MDHNYSPFAKRQPVPRLHSPTLSSFLLPASVIAVLLVGPALAQEGTLSENEIAAGLALAATDVPEYVARTTTGTTDVTVVGDFDVVVTLRNGNEDVHRSQGKDRAKIQ
jgi:hypothetical protein